jgi:hypothetical protein
MESEKLALLLKDAEEERAALLSKNAECVPAADAVPRSCCE